MADDGDYEAPVAGDEEEEEDDDEFVGDEEEDDEEAGEEPEDDDDDDGGAAKKSKKAAPVKAAASAAKAAPKVRADAKPKAAAGAGAAAPPASSSSSSKAGGAGPAPSTNIAAAAVAAGKKILDEKTAKAVLLDYLNKTNRPYSGLIIHDNLHGVIGKTVINKLLDELAESGAIAAKTFGKARVYWAEQSQYGEVDEEEMRAYEARGKEAQEKLAGLKQRRRELESQLAAMNSALTAEQLDAELKTYRTAVAAGREKLAKLSGGGAVLVTPQEKAAVKATLDRYRKAWAERKRMVTDVIDSMAEALEKKPAALYEAIGIETDEEMGVKIRDFMTT